MFQIESIKIILRGHIKKVDPTRENEFINCFKN